MTSLEGDQSQSHENKEAQKDGLENHEQVLNQPNTTTETQDQLKQDQIQIISNNLQETEKDQEISKSTQAESQIQVQALLDPSSIVWQPDSSGT